MYVDAGNVVKTRRIAAPFPPHQICIGRFLRLRLRGGKADEIKPIPKANSSEDAKARTNHSIFPNDSGLNPCQIPTTLFPAIPANPFAHTTTLYPLAPIQPEILSASFALPPSIPSPAPLSTSLSTPFPSSTIHYPPMVVKKIVDVFETMPTTNQVLREIKILKMCEHPNIVRLDRVLTPQTLASQIHV